MTPKEFETTLSDAEVQLSRLKHLYEQWFQGIERLEPMIPRKQFDRTLHDLRKGQPRNTYLRFRFNTLIQRYTTLQTYWRRVSRQIEEGTYRRDLMRARRRREQARWEREAERKVSSGGSDPVELDPNAKVDVDALIAEASDRVDEYIEESKERDSTDRTNGASRPDPPRRSPRPGSRSVPSLKPSANGQPETARFGRPKSSWPAVVDDRPSKLSEPMRRRKPVGPLPPSNRKTPPPLPLRSKGPGDARLRQIYDSYVRAKEQNNEPTDRIDYETVAKSIKKMVPKLDRKHKGKRIDFKVVVQDGKVGLKPIVKK